MPETVDVVVIGMGPGGAAVAGNLAQYGLSCVGVDQSLPEDAPATDGSSDLDAVDQFTGMGGMLERGVARLAGPRTVAVDGGRVFRAARAIVLSDEAWPRIPSIEGLQGTPFWTERDALEVEDPPDSLIVVGGGPTGLELAQGFFRHGSRVDVVEVRDRLLPSEEPEVGEFVAEMLRREGIGIHTDATVREIQHEAGVFSVDVGDTRLTAERLLILPRRGADLAAVGIDTIGLDATAEHLDPDDRMRVADGVYAIGDITGEGAFAHVSLYQAAIASSDILGTSTDDADYHAVPRVTFTDPEVGSAGLTERQARAAGFSVRTGTGRMPRSTQAGTTAAGGAGMVKLVEDSDRGVLIGATAAGPSGGEVPGLVLAAHAQMPTQRLRRMMYAYPGFQSAIEEALSTMD